MEQTNKNKRRDIMDYKKAYQELSQVVMESDLSLIHI